jgi:glutaredoxin 2
MLSKNPKGAGRKPVPYKTKLVQYRVPESEVREFKAEVAPIINRLRIEANSKVNFNQKYNHTLDALNYITGKETTILDTLNEKLANHTNK